MVSKCANPDCVATFRYFHVGKLFRIETSAGLERRHSMGQDDAVLDRPRLRRVEFYWLCDKCASKMTLVFDRDAGMSVRANSRAESAAA
jgi:hypothetical protein